MIDHSQGRCKRNISIQSASTTCGSPREKEADLVAFLTAVCTPERGVPLGRPGSRCRLRTGFTKAPHRKRMWQGNPACCHARRNAPSHKGAALRTQRPELRVRRRNTAIAALSAALEDKSQLFFQSPQSCEIRRMRESGFTHHQASSGNAPVSGCRRRTGTYMLR